MTTWVDGAGTARDGIGSLLLGAHDDNHHRLVYIGHVGTGFSQRTGERCRRARADRAAHQPARHRRAGTGRPRRALRRTEAGRDVEYREFVGSLRHPSWKGPREDKTPDEVDLPGAALTPRGTRIVGHTRHTDRHADPTHDGRTRSGRRHRRTRRHQSRPRQPGHAAGRVGPLRLVGSPRRVPPPPRTSSPHRPVSAAALRRSRNEPAPPDRQQSPAPQRIVHPAPHPRRAAPRRRGLPDPPHRPRRPPRRGRDPPDRVDAHPPATVLVPAPDPRRRRGHRHRPVGTAAEHRPHHPRTRPRRHHRRTHRVQHQRLTTTHTHNARPSHGPRRLQQPRPRQERAHPRARRSPHADRPRRCGP
ncbi:DNA-ligase (ATP) [Rhodococcus opacus RKJ300 = JCM 13270]|uniref:DNA ligase (ATP) n=1 Tax=Rhodococcus opacus RKJ300 = JCM 13270 TaxID=1165867 RepID=I0WRJ5_RHOOP|nr:DNA-ligase (ATP) [Rhodococcus opacus RKJ300 = JCM 13270]